MPLYFNPYDPARNNPNGVDMATMINDIAGSPDEIIEMLLGLIDNPDATYGFSPTVPDGGLFTNSSATYKKFSDVVNTDGVHPTRGVVYAPALLTPGQYTPLWSFTRSHGVPEMNEAWVDTSPFSAGPNASDGSNNNREIELHFREKPFVNLFEADESIWYYLPCAVLNMQEIKSVSLQKSGAERYNHVQVLCEMDPVFQLDAFALCPPTANYSSVRRWGLKKLDVTLSLMSIYEGDDVEQLIAELHEWRDLFVCWNILNPYYYQGTIEVAGIRADIRVGYKVLIEGGAVSYAPHGLPSDPGGDYRGDPAAFAGYGVSGGLVDSEINLGRAQTFYVEAVSYNWGSGASPTASTTIQVSRGYVENDRLAHMDALYKNWSDATNTDTTLASNGSLVSQTTKWSRTTRTELDS